jgi:putative endonuclease
MLENKKMTLGKQGEDIAANYLDSNNYLILSRNFFSSFGELDIIVLKEDTVVFVEVKTRTSNFTNAFNSVSFVKQQKMTATASAFLNSHPEYEDFATRFDVISIIFKQNQFSLKHLKDAFI